jgi:hypothetical protein
VFDVASAKRDNFLEVESLQSAAFGAGGALRVVLTEKDGPVVWSANPRRRIWQPPAEGRWQFGILSPDGGRVIGVACPPEGPTRLTLCDIATGRRLAEFTMPRVTWVDSVPPPMFSPDGRWLAVPTRAGRATAILRLPSLEPAFTLPPNIFSERLSFSPAGDVLTQCHADGGIRFWHLERGDELFGFQATPTAAKNHSFTPDGTFVFHEQESPHLQALRMETLRRQLAKLGLAW